MVKTNKDFPLDIKNNNNSKQKENIFRRNKERGLSHCFASVVVSQL